MFNRNVISGKIDCTWNGYKLINQFNLFLLRSSISIIGTKNYAILKLVVGSPVHPFPFNHTALFYAVWSFLVMPTFKSYRLPKRSKAKTLINIPLGVTLQSVENCSTCHLEKIQSRSRESQFCLYIRNTLLFNMERHCKNQTSERSYSRFLNLEGDQW